LKLKLNLFINHFILLKNDNYFNIKLINLFMISQTQEEIHDNILILFLFL